MQTLAQELELKTRKYWHLSQQWNGAIVSTTPTHRAISTCNDVVYGTNPARPIVHRMKVLRADIIRGESDPPREQSSAVIPLQRTS